MNLGMSDGEFDNGMGRAPVRIQSHRRTWLWPGWKRGFGTQAQQAGFESNHNASIDNTGIQFSRCLDSELSYILPIKDSATVEISEKKSVVCKDVH